jgi:hypothetical protein
MKTPDIATGLLAVDEALASGRPDAADPAARELQEIALALRADSPEPDPAFARRLDERVERRFARPRRVRSLLPTRRLALAGAAGLLTAIAAAGAIAGLSGNGGDEASPLSVAPSATGDSAAVRTPGVHDAMARKAPLGGEPFSTEGGPAGSAASGRRVEHTASLKLASPADELDEVADRVVDVTDRHRGLVLNSSVSTGADSAQGGSFELRVPTTELTDTLRDLSRLGEVRERHQFEQDVTREYSTVAGRLASARVERRGIQRRLAHATTTAEADRLRGRLDLLNAEIHRLREQVGRLRVRTDYTRLSVTLVARKAAASPIGGAGDALRGSLRALVEAVAVTLRVLAAMLPFLLLGGLAWAAAGVVRRRRREAVLS